MKLETTGVVGSKPTAVYQLTDIPETEEESILHPLRAVRDIIHAIHEQTAVSRLLLQLHEKELSFTDRMEMVGATVGWSADYQDRRYLYVFSRNAVTLNFSSGGSVSVPAGAWFNISPPKGTIITISGGSDVTLTALLFRASDGAFANASNVTVTGSSGVQSSTGSVSSVASSATSITLLVANANRKGACFFNDSTSVLYLSLSSSASSTSTYTAKVLAQGYYEMPSPSIYQGAITGIWASANGACLVTELT